MEEELKNIYKKLYKNVNDLNKERRKQDRVDFLTICPAIKGELYDTQNKKFMFVGRAINGWCELPDNESDFQKMLDTCTNKCGLGWVIGQWDWYKCDGCKYAETKAKEKEGVYSNRTNSPFWQLVKYICEQEGIGDCWYKKILWSNLYKASYLNGGNPYDYYEQQILYCNEILNKEIEIYKPTKIFFITENFSMLKNCKCTWFCKEYVKKSILNFRSVYNTIKEKGVETYILSRPEFKSKEKVYQNRKNINSIK